MNIRPATNADAEAIRLLVFGILEEYDLVAEHEGVDADLNDIQAEYMDRGGLFEVIEDESGLIGTVGLYPRSEGICQLRKMFLVPSARGQGLGKQMLERMLERAKLLGFRRMELETASVLVEAIGLYTSYGFTPINPEDLAARCDQAFALELTQ